VVVERVYRGGAELRVNGSFTARLEAEEFPEVAGLLRKKASFRARGSLYRESGELYLRPVEILP